MGLEEFGQNGQNLNLRIGAILLKSLSAKDAKYGFGRLIDMALAAPVVIQKHGRPVVVVMAVEEFSRLKNQQLSEHKSPKRSKRGA